MNEQCMHLLDYFNRSLTEEESLAFEKHLEECPSCSAELEELNLLTEDLPYLTEEIDVPSNLKAKVFAAIDETPYSSENETKPNNHTIEAFPVRPKETKPVKRRGVAVPVLAAALVASLATNAYLATTDEPPSTEVAESNLQLIGKALLDPQPGADNATAVAMMIKDNNETVLLVDASNLPKLKDNELYQVWVIEQDTPQPAGSFTPSEDGNGSVTHSMDQLEGKWDTVAITIETEPNLPSPKGSIVLAGSI
ncbi:anti-sigma factor [Sporosarcina aquimarina]|uniref:Anti-sigma-W factor RsiW n=1 Tax=Sporosarcina aquimarina TaxID=114975 RepID=A0ABU4G100_9BACL|nr:anti-sigma factor [Sporosarcina aquimarina]MDW0110646.1 anti-sigma factor [Sporosarcina aquimarina]